MVPTVTVNGLTIVHQASDGVITSGAPDVCRSPRVPVPYVNVARSRDLQHGSVTVSFDGVPGALKESYFLPSYGDEPGVGGGIVSGVNRGKAKFTAYSMDVLVEGRNAARLSDPMSMNGNQPNTHGPAELQGNLPPAGPDRALLCRIFCWCDAGRGAGDFVAPILPDMEA